MLHVLDVAKYILEKRGEMPAMKLQKLCYYSQAWALIWDDAPLFDDRIEAWANGPVAPVLYDAHRGLFQVSAKDVGESVATIDNSTQRDTIDSVLHYYGDKSSQWLSDLTHQEDPWRNAREGLRAGERSNREITQAAMAEYYGSL